MLTKPVAICVNRGGQSLDTAKMVAESLGWPIIGVDPRDLLLVDAGNAIIGLGFQIVSTVSTLALSEPVSAEDPAISGDCAGESSFFLPASTEPSIASTFEFASSSIDEDAEKPARHLELPAAVLTRNKHAGTGTQRLHWNDVNGNLFTFAQFDEEGLKGKRGAFYRKLLERRGFQLGKRNQFDNTLPLVGVTLLVSDLERSRAWYEERLGLKVIDADRDDVSLDAGNIILRLRPESSTGLVRRYRMTMALRDQFSFYTPDIRAETASLVKAGVAFPRGIEWSVSGGALAKMPDPDGYNLWLWQPQPRYIDGMPIDYTPVVNRILGEQGLPLPRDGYYGPYVQEQVDQAILNPPPPLGVSPTTPPTTKG
jgi:catechol 2,3-dioxygenase-like lactoylglutathione lyase family enzyme